MVSVLGRAVADLGNRRVLAIMLQAVAIAVAIFAILGGLLAWFLSRADPCGLIGIRSCPLGAGTGTISAIALILIAAWFLFPAVAIIIITSFTDRIAGTVETLHYPWAAEEARSIGMARGLILGLKSAGRLILFNLLALPFYLFLLVTGIGPIVLFVIVNGIAFGRDVAELAAARHGNSASRREWLKQTRGQQHMIGLLVSVLFLIPFANLVGPVIGTAAGIHLFNRTFWTMNQQRIEKRHSRSAPT